MVVASGLNELWRGPFRYAGQFVCVAAPARGAAAAKRRIRIEAAQLDRRRRRIFPALRALSRGFAETLSIGPSAVNRRSGVDAPFRKWHLTSSPQGRSDQARTQS